MSRIVVVGIGADGWDGLTPAAQQAISSADVLFGSARQLATIPGTAQQVGWPTPLLPALDGLLAEHADRRRVVIASGDPMFFGIGATLARTHDVEVIPHVSSASLACARMGWALQDVTVVSLVGRPLASLQLAVSDGARVLVLSASAATPGEVAGALELWGFGASTLTVLSQLGGPDESTEVVDDLNVIALECRGTGLPRVGGLPDEAFENDGQITKREVRAVLLSLLAPQPGQLLWDVGAGTGSVGIEWARAGGRTVAVEKSPDKCARIVRNASALGVPSLQVVEGGAPDVLASCDAPHAVFVGGGATAPGMLDACWSALRPGGRLVVNAVTVESEAVLLAWQAKHGGSLLRLSVQRTAPVGGFTGWKPMTSLTIWSVTR
jgi:precorrin-6Y C5,15-methyltransferase (decarboxylating)